MPASICPPQVCLRTISDTVEQIVALMCIQSHRRAKKARQLVAEMRSVRIQERAMIADELPAMMREDEWSTQREWHERKYVHWSGIARTVSHWMDTAPSCFGLDVLPESLRSCAEWQPCKEQSSLTQFLQLVPSKMVDTALRTSVLMLKLLPDDLYNGALVELFTPRPSKKGSSAVVAGSKIPFPVVGIMYSTVHRMLHAELPSELLAPHDNGARSASLAKSLADAAAAEPACLPDDERVMIVALCESVDAWNKQKAQGGPPLSVRVQAWLQETTMSSLLPASVVDEMGKEVRADELVRREGNLASAFPLKAAAAASVAAHDMPFALLARDMAHFLYDTHSSGLHLHGAATMDFEGAAVGHSWSQEWGALPDWAAHRKLAPEADVAEYARLQQQAYHGSLPPELWPCVCQLALSLMVRMPAFKPAELDPAADNTVSLVKADCLAKPGALLDVIMGAQNAGLEIVGLRLVHMGEAQLKASTKLTSYVPPKNNNPMLTFVLRGSGAVEEWAEALGPNDPEKARENAPDTIRVCACTWGCAFVCMVVDLMLHHFVGKMG